ncbi:N-formylglutamate amidohydrolase [Roseibium denhamense]|nr:N-formylglutamate amidohydrolase [Roseibium denhamense]
MTRFVQVDNRLGSSPLVLLCDHASNAMPAPYDTSLGIQEADKTAHVAWDPGALGVAKCLSELLDAALIYPTLSRLIIDCNRDEKRVDLCPPLSENTVVPGNQDLSGDERKQRLDLVHRPFHREIAGLLDQRSAQNRPAAVVSIHSYTPVFKGRHRPWEIGLIYDTDTRLADPVLAALKACTGLSVGDNEPYAPSDGVYYTIDRHGQSRGLPCLMIEIRNDEIASKDQERKWAELLAPMLSSAVNAATVKEARTNA